MHQSLQPSMFYGASAETFKKAQLLRKKMTGAEKALWKRLNKNQLGVRFKPQHPIAIYIVDFYCHPYKLVVEVDGGYHNDPDQVAYDNKRTAELEELGLRVIRFTNKQVQKEIDKVLDEIQSAVAEGAAPKGDFGVCD